MTGGGPSMRHGLALGAVAVVAAEAIVAALVVWSGVVDVAATRSGPQDRILAYASTRSIAHHAKDERNPLAHDPGALRAGLRHYREMCVECHGGPGVEPEELAAGLHPAPPDLASGQVQAFTDGMLYDVIARGIGSTGMPAFGRTHAPEDLWSIVAFVRQLPALTPDEKAALARGGPREEEGHGAHEAAAPPHEHGAAAGARGDEAGAPAGAGHSVHRVTISGFKYSPADLEVHEGDVVEWKNEDFVAHTATADDRKSFDTGRIDAGETKRIVAKGKGRFPYFCRYHAAMKGTIVVR